RFLLARMRQRVDEPHPVRFARAEYVTVFSSRHDVGRDFHVVELYAQPITGAGDACRAITLADRERDRIASRADAHPVFAASCLEAKRECVLVAVGPPCVEDLPWR